MQTIMTSNDRTAGFFDGYASGFDAIYGNKNTLFNRFVNKAFRGVMRERFERTLAGCSPIEGKSVLDIGSGPGHYSVALARAGAKEVLGLDFAKGMLDVARKNAEVAGVGDKCTWEEGDFVLRKFDRKYDYSILMGFMDYMADPIAVVKKVAEVTADRAFFSFPTDDGLLAWQRKIRYKSRCDLYLYTRGHIDAIMKHTGKKFTIDSLGRDFFVTLHAGS